MPYKDKSKQKKAQQEWYKRNKELVSTRRYKHHKRYKKRNKLLAERYKVFVGCRVCGYNKCPQALDFHHLHNKKDAVGSMLNSAYALRTIKEEIRKCVVLCAICHRELHAGYISLEHHKNKYGPLV